jgi:peptide-methionine (R)-S-oxide reductase
MKHRLSFLAAALLAGCSAGGGAPSTEPAPPSAVEKSDDAWKGDLTDEQYRVLRQCGTEPAFSGAYWNTKTPGVYRCAGCGAPLFDSNTKYDSGSGWPSFYEPMADSSVSEQPDDSLLVTRTEVKCARCGGHLGHVFDDGPAPTGLRYCINSAALSLEERGE